jgi:hypothetical protein
MSGAWEEWGTNRSAKLCLEESRIEIRNLLCLHVWAMAITHMLTLASLYATSTVQRATGVPGASARSGTGSAQRAGPDGDAKHASMEHGSGLASVQHAAGWRGVALGGGTRRTGEPRTVDAPTGADVRIRVRRNCSQRGMPPPANGVVKPGCEGARRNVRRGEGAIVQKPSTGISENLVPRTDEK